MQIRFLIDFSYIIVAFVVIGACVDAMALPIPIWIVLRLVVFLGRYSILWKAILILVNENFGPNVKLHGSPLL